MKKIRRQKVNVRDQVSHPYKAKDIIMVICVCADVYLLYENSEDKWFSKQWYQEFFMHQMFLFLVYFQNVWYLPFFSKVLFVISYCHLVMKHQYLGLLTGIFLTIYLHDHRPEAQRIWVFFSNLNIMAVRFKNNCYKIQLDGTRPQSRILLA